MDSHECKKRLFGQTKDGIEIYRYWLDVNDGKNNRHSHYDLGYHKRVWNVEEGNSQVTLVIEDEDGCMGFPGNKKVQVTYRVTDNNELKIHYEVGSEKNTIINMTNHTYFNLAGHKEKIYDHNWVLDNADGTLREFATVREPVTGRCMKAYTDLSGVQFYAGNSIFEQAGKDNAIYGPRSGLCLETQYFPNSANKRHFPSPVFGPNRKYVCTTVYKFY